MTAKNHGLYIALVSIHGLIRGNDLELGRDADTGGQTKYVVELARALGEHPRVARVDLLTRRVVSPEVSEDYGRVEDQLSPRASIVRIECGEPGYLPKEQLWSSLDVFTDRAMVHFGDQERPPDIIHGHYADAGYVGAHLAQQLGVPFVFTGHSLGRVKRRRLLASGLDRERIEEHYNITRRIAAEEEALGAADLVVTSTRQEIESQYALYDYYRPEQMGVVPPGVDLERFHPPLGNERQAGINGQLARFLRRPEKPMILAVSRADRRKNITTLLQAYGESPSLQDKANLIIVAGNRADINDLERGAREELTAILLAIDRYDLYGKAAYPKRHRFDDVPVLYRLAALSRGVFTNPALTEPFGLTLLEAAASGLPIVATEDGGPTDIIGNCDNGLLVDPLNPEAIASALTRVLDDKEGWKTMAANGISGVRRHYSWDAHTRTYMAAMEDLVKAAPQRGRVRPQPWGGRFRDRAIFSDLDKSLLGDETALAELVELIRANRRRAAFGIATGRRLEAALRMMRRHDIPRPDVLISSLGTDIYYAPNLTRDTRWREHIDHLWHPRELRRLLSDVPGIEEQPAHEQGEFKISYYIDPEIAPTPEDITRLMHRNEQTVNVIHSFGKFLDIIPVRASKGAALRWFALQREVPLDRVLTAGGSGADESLLLGETLGVVVANRHHEELSGLADRERILFAARSFAGGILEAIEHYDFFGECRVPVE